MNKTDVSFRPKDSSHDVNPNYVPPASVNRPRKTTMELVWHNCKTCPPEEVHNECLYITNGDGVFEVEWDNGYWLDYDGHVISNVDKHGNEFWWADIDQTTAEFFKSIGLFKQTFL